jgi:hypothetical protein
MNIFLRMKNWIPVIFLLIILVGCKEEKTSGIYEKGRLEYKITYLNADQGNFDPSLLPRKMVLEFNNEFSTNTIDGFMECFGLATSLISTKEKA